MALAAELSAFYDNVHATLPAPTSQTIKKSTNDFVASYDPKTAIQVGSKLPPFNLIDANGNKVSSSDLIPKGPLLINFYRGGWCPYCNIALHGFQQRLEEFKAKGVTFVAVTPELPDSSLTTIEKNELKFPVLTDVKNKFAGELGILFAQPEAMRSILEGIDGDLRVVNGSEDLVVPVPATFLVDKSGVVRNAFVDADYAHRLEPATALEWVDALKV